MSDMAPRAPSGLLPPHEHQHVRPAIFEDFARLQQEAPPTASVEHPLSTVPAAEVPSASAVLEYQETLSGTAEQMPTDMWQAELQAAYEQGFEDGKTAAAALYEAEFRRYHQWLQRFDEVVRSVRLQVQQLSEVAELASVRLAFVLAEHILGCEVHQHPEQIAQLLRRALQALPDDQRTLRIRLHPDTFEALQRAESSIISGQESGMTFVPDPSVDPVGCIIESPWGTVDAQVRQQLQNIREQLGC